MKFIRLSSSSIKIVFLILSMSIYTSAFSQNNSIKKSSFYNLLDTNKLIILPTNVTNLTKNFGFKPEVANNELCKNGVYYSWNFDSGINLIFVELLSNEQYVSLSYFGEDKIDDLPLGLVFNDSTFKECRIKFSKYKPKWYQKTYSISENEAAAYFVLEFKIKDRYIQLAFLNNSELSGIVISTSEID